LNSVDADKRELLTLLQISPAADDFLVGTCGDGWQRVEPGAAAARFAERQRKRLKAPASKGRRAKGK
jgi:hypothetical protein